MSLKYNPKERENWVKSMNPDYINQTWHDMVVLHPSQMKHFDYFKPDKTYVDTIDPKKIIGIEYAYEYNCPYYNDKKRMNWKDLLSSLKRLDRIIDNFNSKEKLIDFIKKHNELKAVIKYGNHYFTTSGQHRLCLAKYLDIEKIEVQILDFKLDKEFFIREKKIAKYKSKLIKYKLIDENFKNNRTNEYLTITIQGKTFFINKLVIENLIKELERLMSKKNTTFHIFLTKILKPSVFDYYWINNKNELFLLEHILLKHVKSLKLKKL